MRTSDFFSLLNYILPLQNRLLVTIYELCQVGMISGFVVVLYLRLKILFQSQRVRRLSLAMIAMDGIFLHTAIFVVVNGKRLADSLALA